MKRFLPFLIIGGAILAVWYWFSRGKKLTDLQQHQGELSTNAAIGQIASSALNFIRPPSQTYSSRGPLDGAIVPLTDLFNGIVLPQNNSPTFRPTYAGDEASDSISSYNLD